MMLSKWQQMAARIGAITIYEFYQICQGIDKMVTTCPTLDALVDKTARKDASKLFNEKFPNFADTRHFAAHGVEMTRFRNDIDRNSTLDPLFIGSTKLVNNGRMSIYGCLFNIEYINTHNGKIIKYVISQETFVDLVQVTKLRNVMFASVETATWEMEAEIIRQRREPQPDI